MKKLILFIGTILMLIGCNRNQNSYISYVEENHTSIKNENSLQIISSSSEVKSSSIEVDLYIVSGTLDIIAETVARHIGADTFYATEMVYGTNGFTGKFNDLLLTKSSAIPHYNDYDIITDNLTDIELVRKAHKATIIAYNNRNRWAAFLPPDIDVTYIDAREQRY